MDSSSISNKRELASYHLLFVMPCNPLAFWLFFLSLRGAKTIAAWRAKIAFKQTNSINKPRQCRLPSCIRWQRVCRAGSPRRWTRSVNSDKAAYSVKTLVVTGCFGCTTIPTQAVCKYGLVGWRWQIYLTGSSMRGVLIVIKIQKTNTSAIRQVTQVSFPGSGPRPDGRTFRKRASQKEKPKTRVVVSAGLLERAWKRRVPPRWKRDRRLA